MKLHTLAAHAFPGLLLLLVCSWPGGAHSPAQVLQNDIPTLHQQMQLMMDGDGDDIAELATDLGTNAAANDELDDETSLWQKLVDNSGPPPLDPIYKNASTVAAMVENQGSVGFVPEGARSDLDLSPEEKQALASVFDERPDLFQNCMLIRDYAEPLRVESALMDRRHLATPVSDSLGEDHQLPNGTLPEDVLFVKGGVFDRDAARNAEAEPVVSMFASLRSVTGEVAVVPNGGIAQWTSKKKVPIAGYLCTEDGRSVLYTLATPCLATTLGDDGLPRPPRMAPSGAEAPAASPQPPPGLAGLLAERERLDPENVEPPTADDFVVHVGGAKLHFSSKEKAESFCLQITESISQDIGDHEFDTDLVAGATIQKDTTSPEFMQLARKTPAKPWTLGKKKLLVLVMDWKYGDNSRRPYSRQKKTVGHYKNVIFPRVRNAFQQMSYGKFDIVPTFVPEVLRFVKPRSHLTSRGYPFPGLYIGARDALQMHPKFGRSYSFDDYDLVYVIAPQQAPVLTKGVAYVGAKGAICNGCEEISDNFQVMVAVHELGHNLGLSHASSKSIEYGNPYDWMGNYPDVTGLSFGAGYKMRLNWLARDAVVHIKDGDVGSLNDRFIIRPFDVDREPQQGELAAIQLSLTANTRDLFISYRKSIGDGNSGVFIVLQDKGTPDSELIDLACHSRSQRDARLRVGWTYLDPSSKVVVYLESQSDDSATLHLFTIPKPRIPAIRGRALFTDGVYKCPRTCTDSDLLVSDFKGCSALSSQGYCNGGSITMDGIKMSVGLDLCPESCGRCDDALDGSTIVGEGGGCSDRNIRISGMACYQVRAAGYCDRSTNLGHIGQDLCPRSCGNCPPQPSSEGSSQSYQNPIPRRTRGAASKGQSETTSDAPLISSTTKTMTSSEICSDESGWTDKEGDGCSVYADFIEEQKLTQNQACDYGDGSARIHCKRTCGACGLATTTPPAQVTTSMDQQASDEAASSAPCEDKECVESWQESFGQCFKCSEFKDTYCGHDALFMQSCPKSCKLCTASPSPCANSFEQSSCEEWAALGFCDQPKIVQSCRKTCGLCGEASSALKITGNATLARGGQEAAVLDAPWEWGSKRALQEAVRARHDRSPQKSSGRTRTCFAVLEAILLTALMLAD